MYSVYILKSLKDQGYYIGCTKDLHRRVRAHNLGKTQSLKSRRPLEIIYKEDYTVAAEAFARERQIKSYNGGEAFKRLLKGGFA